MRINRSLASFAGAIALAAIAALGAAGPLGAQGFDPELERFRDRLAAHNAELLAVYPHIAPTAPPSLLKSLTRSQEMIPRLTQEELAILRNAIAEDSLWWDFPGTLLDIFEPVTAGVAAVTAVAGPSPLLTHSCPPGTPIAVLFALKGTAQAINFLQLFAPDDLVVVVAGEGGTISAHPIKIALQFGFEAAQTAVLAAELISAINDECETENHRAIVHDLLAIRTVKLHVFEVKDPGDDGRARFLLHATESGIPVDVTLVSVQAARLDEDEPITFLDITTDTLAMAVTTGTLDVKITPFGVLVPDDDHPGEFDLEEFDVVEFRVEHDDDGVKRFGAIVFHTKHKRRLAGGQ